MTFNAKLGYYEVGQQRLYSKIDACLLATRLNTHVEWRFSDDVWNSQDWTQEPEIDIMELYRQRARQIREAYDYVIINYSGGCDSQTVVDAFLSAGCFIDEIVTIWNRSHTPKVDGSGHVTDPANVESEFELTTRPGLDRILLASPRTKITYTDVSGHTVQSYQTLDGAEWLKTTTEHLNPQFVTRYAATRDRDQLVRLDRGRRTAIIFGADKPKVCIKDSKYHVYFIDILANNCKAQSDRPEYDNIDTVFFYWTPDLPQLIIKQAHLIRRWFESNPALKPILIWPNQDYARRNAYEVIIRTVIYPNWDMNTYQCVKPQGSVWNDWDDWFFRGFAQTSTYHSWLSGLEYVQKHIDKRFLKYDFHDRFDGFVGMINGHFCLE